MKTTRRLNFFAAVLTVLLGGNSALKGDDSVSQSPALPPGPLLSNGGDVSAWEIDYSYATDQSSTVAADGTAKPTYPVPPPNSYLLLPIRKVMIFRSKPQFHVTIIELDGEQFDQWSDGDLTFFRTPDSSAITIFSDPRNALKFPDVKDTDFPDMEWVSPSNYMGVQTIRSRPCFVFTQKGETAWIDTQTLFAVQWQKGDETRVFKQLPNLTSFSLPPEVQKISAEAKKELNAWKRPSPMVGQ